MLGGSGEGGGDVVPVGFCPNRWVRGRMRKKRSWVALCGVGRWGGSFPGVGKSR